MLKYKRINVTGLTATEEKLEAILSGMAGKNRKIVSVGTEYQAAAAPSKYLRVYRDADQIVDCDLSKLWNENRWLEMDLPLAEGQVCRVGVYGIGYVNDLEITIGYTEAE